MSQFVNVGRIDEEHFNKGNKYNKGEDKAKQVKYFAIAALVNVDLKKYAKDHNESQSKVIEDSIKAFIYK